jgi:hypothetical protein
VPWKSRLAYEKYIRLSIMHFTKLMTIVQWRCAAALLVKIAAFLHKFGILKVDGARLKRPKCLIASSECDIERVAPLVGSTSFTVRFLLRRHTGS